MNAIYYSDGQQMHLGDNIRIRRLLRQARVATVDYLSGESPPHASLEIPGLVTFSIKSNCVVWSWNRELGKRLEKKFQLIQRGSASDPVAPTEELE
jgi:hypothetical protein